MKSRNRIKRDEIKTPKPSLLPLLESNWRLIPGENDVRIQGNVFLKDSERGSIQINNSTFSDSSEYQKMSAEYSKEQALKDFVRRSLLSEVSAEKFEILYTQLTKFWTQLLFTTFEYAMINSTAEFIGDSTELKRRSTSTIQCETTTITLTYEDGKFCVYTESMDLVYKYIYLYNDPTRDMEEGSIPLPGSVTSCFEITDEGPQLAWLEPSNFLVKDLLLQKSVDVKKRMEDLLFLQRLKEEIANALASQQSEMMKMAKQSLEENNPLMTKIITEYRKGICAFGKLTTRILEINAQRQEKFSVLKRQVTQLTEEMQAMKKEIGIKLHSSNQLTNLQEKVTELTKKINKPHVELHELKNMDADLNRENKIAESKLNALKTDCLAYKEYLKKLLVKDDPSLLHLCVSPPIFDEQCEKIIGFQSLYVLDGMAEKACKDQHYANSFAPAYKDALIKYHLVNILQRSLERKDREQPLVKLTQFSILFDNYRPALEKIRSDSVAMDFVKKIAARLVGWKPKGALISSCLDVTLYGNSKNRKQPIKPTQQPQATNIKP